MVELTQKALMSNGIKSLVEMQKHSRTMVSDESRVLDVKESMWIDYCESQIVEVLLGLNAFGLLRSLLGLWNGNRYALLP